MATMKKKAAVKKAVRKPTPNTLGKGAAKNAASAILKRKKMLSDL